MIKRENPDFGLQRISDMLLRGPGFQASPNAVARVLREAGYELEEHISHPHPDKPRFFERAKPNQLWQTDLFTFMLKRQNRRVHLVGFMDDHSRFIVSYGLHATASAALVIEVLRAGVTSYQAPEEVLTDNGPQYITWRGKSHFSRECETRGIKHIVARPRHPQTLGKCERFWGTLWKECLHAAIFVDLEDARRRIGHFIDYYNFQGAGEREGALAGGQRHPPDGQGRRAELQRALGRRAGDPDEPGRTQRDRLGAAGEAGLGSAQTAVPERRADGGVPGRGPRGAAGSGGVAHRSDRAAGGR
jgi:transposase InsO family protein